MSEADDGWISVTRGTPAREEPVLGYCASGVRVVLWRGYKSWVTVPGAWTVRPSHWRRLPDPPVLP